MAAQSFFVDGHSSRRPPVRRNGLVQLGWPHFWLFGGILGGLLSLAGFILFIYSLPR